MRASEDELIARYFQPIAGPGALALGDDAAILRPPEGCDVIVSVDALTAGGHFFPDDPPDLVAGKALRVNVSDLVAKGADPLGFLLTLALPPDWREDWLSAFSAGLAADAQHFGCALLGGDTIRIDGPLTLSITIFGAVPRNAMVRRSGAQAGDSLYVTGTIGDSAAGLALRSDPARWTVTPQQREHVLSRYLTPQPRVPLTASIRAYAHAAMDISDGLMGDARKLLARSGLGGCIDLRLLPLSGAARTILAQDASALQVLAAGGDDYEILCAIPAKHQIAFEAQAAHRGVAVTKVGEVVGSGAEVTFLGLDGKPTHFTQESFGHFSALS